MLKVLAGTPDTSSGTSVSGLSMFLKDGDADVISRGLRSPVILFTMLWFTIGVVIRHVITYVARHRPITLK
ncbi:hypothetical protein BgiBS90_013956 [Biomphalaria glabrata]|nr:hypothetical protein BgiBS90_013956 [Biomphalaria glabrata]